MILPVHRLIAWFRHARRVKLAFLGAAGLALIIAVGWSGFLLLSAPVGTTGTAAATPPAGAVAVGESVPATLASETRPQGLPALAPSDGSSPFAEILVPPPPPPPRTGFVTHVVQPSEVLWQIAEEYQIRSESLVWVNDLADPNLLQVGQNLRIPPVDGVMYTVRAGDRLGDVVNRYGVDLTAVVKLNGLSDIDQISVGRDLFLPGARPLRRATTADLAQSPAAGADQQAALAAPPVPLPANIGDLLNAGWLVTTAATPLYKGSDGLKPLHPLDPGVRLERLDGFERGRVQVRDPGDGTTRQAMTGWVDAMGLDVGRAPGARELSLSYPRDTAMDIYHVFAPYRTQLDGSVYQGANCGPTAIAMALDAFGVSIGLRQLRAEALDAQGIHGNYVGTILPALASVVRSHGLATYGMYDADGSIHRWTTEDLQRQITAGRPVIVQVKYRSLPGRAGSAYFADHYVLVTGNVQDGFLYNDPIDYDGLGWDRFINADRLAVAMNASDGQYAHAGFAVGT